MTEDFGGSGVAEALQAGRSAVELEGLRPLWRVELRQLAQARGLEAWRVDVAAALARAPEARRRTWWAVETLRWTLGPAQ